MATDAKGKEGADQALIRDLAELLKETGLSEIEIERAGKPRRVFRDHAGFFHYRLGLNRPPTAT